MKRGRTIYVLFVFGLYLWLMPSFGQAATVNCNQGQSLQAAINAAVSGNFVNPTVINVTGTCNQNVVIDRTKNNIILNGGGKATVNGVDANEHTVQVLGRGIVIKGFAITGGSDGIQVVRGGTALIDGNNIHDAHNNGISVGQVSHAEIINNTIQNNPNHGIVVNANSSAHIGFVSYSDTTAKRNTIQGNGNQGIRVQRSAFAAIVKNIIRNNTNNGIHVTRASHADISGNAINGNGDNGIKVDDNSGVNLGNPGGTTIFDLANTTTVNNLKRGIYCEIGGYADGLLGTLNGVNGDALFDATCIDSLQ